MFACSSFLFFFWVAYKTGWETETRYRRRESCPPLFDDAFSLAVGTHYLDKGAQKRTSSREIVRIYITEYAGFIVHEDVTCFFLILLSFSFCDQSKL